VTIPCKTQTVEQEIGIDRSSHTWQTLQVDRYRFGFGAPGGSWYSFWMGLDPNHPVFDDQTRPACWFPGLVANNTDRLPIGMNDFLPAVIGKTDCNTLPAPC